MKRRAFVKLIAASMAAPLIPAQLLQAGSFLEPIRDTQFIKFYEQWWDYDNVLSIAAEFPDGRRYASSLVIRPKDVTEEHRDMMKRSLITWWKDNHVDSLKPKGHPVRPMPLV